MATDEGEDSASIHSPVDEEIRIVQAALLQMNQSAQQFEEGLETLMALNKNNGQLEKAEASSMAEFRGKFDNQLSELNNWIEKFQFAEAMPRQLDEALEQATEIKATTEKLIESFKKKVRIYRAAEEADRREQQMESIGSSMDAMISQLSKTALKAALMRIILFAQKFEDGLDMLMGLKRNDDRLEKAIAGSMDGVRGNFNNLVVELTNWIGKLQGTEAIGC